MRVRVYHTLGDLERDLTRASTVIPRKGPAVVKRNVKAGERAAVRFSKGASGPHGKHLFKRIESEMTGALIGEFGYRGSRFVGGNFRHGRNMDMPNAADLIGPKFAKDAGDLLDGIL